MQRGAFGGLAHDPPEPARAGECGRPRATPMTIVGPGLAVTGKHRRSVNRIRQKAQAPMPGIPAGLLTLRAGGQGATGIRLRRIGRGFPASR